MGPDSQTQGILHLNGGDNCWKGTLGNEGDVDMN